MYDAYEALVEATTPLPIAEPPSKPIREHVKDLAKIGKGKWTERECPAFLLSLKNQWFSCTVRHSPNGMLRICDAVEGIAGEMSGSPIIITKDGAAIGIVCLSGGGPDKLTEGGPHPRLMGNLPGWFLKTLA